jgi:hypothetical protein
MAHTLGHNESLPGCKIDNPVLKIDQEMSIKNEKEFVNVPVFMPMLFALNHRYPDDRVV